jgi:MFS family permease
MPPYAASPFSRSPQLRPPDPEEAANDRLIWLVGLSHATNHFLMLIFPAVLLLVQAEFELGYAGLGILATASSLCYGLLALPAGMLADRLGGERVLAVWLVGGSLACCGIGLATGPWTLGAGLSVLGLFASLHHPAGSGILVGLRQRLGADVARAFGRTGILGNLGLAGSPILMAAIGAHWGWRAAFFVGAVPGILLFLPSWRQALRTPMERHAPGDRTSQRTGPKDTAFTIPLFLLFGLETLMGFVFQGFSTFLPAHLAGHAGFAALTATQVQRGGAFASLALLFGGLGHLTAGRLMGYRHREALFLATVATSTCCLIGMGTAHGASLVLYSVLFSFAYFALGTISNTFMALHTPPRLGGTVFGITFSLAFGFGSMASSTMGILAERLGLAAVFLTLGLVSLGGVALVIWFGAVTAWRRK